jgi:hypothetical protein
MFGGKAPPLSGAEEQTARTISAYAQGACLLSCKWGEQTRQADVSALPRWFIGIVAGVSAWSRLRIGITVLRLGIAALARRDAHATLLKFFKRLDIPSCNRSPTDRQTDRQIDRQTARQTQT